MQDSETTLIPERLAQTRKQLHLSKAEAARRIGLTAASYVRYEAGDRHPSPQVIQSIAEKLGTSVAFLSGETNDSSPDVIIIQKNEAPVLFEFVKKTKNADSTTLNRLLSYYNKLTNNEDTHL